MEADRSYPTLLVLLFVQIMRLEMTWRALRRNHTETAVLYEKKLKPFMNLLNEGDGECFGVLRDRHTASASLHSCGRCFSDPRAAGFQLVRLRCTIKQTQRKASDEIDLHLRHFIRPHTSTSAALKGFTQLLS